MGACFTQAHRSTDSPLEYRPARVGGVDRVHRSARKRSTDRDSGGDGLDVQRILQRRVRV